MVCVEVTLFCPTSFYLLCLMYLVLNYFILHKLYLRFLRLRRGRKFTDIFTYDLVPFQSGWWWWWGAGREEAAHAASFYWVHKTLNLTHLHPLCCHRCLSRPSCDAQKNISLPKRVQNFEFTHLKHQKHELLDPYWRSFQVWPVWRWCWCEITWLGCIIRYKLWIILEVNYIHKLCAVTDYSQLCCASACTFYYLF